MRVNPDYSGDLAGGSNSNTPESAYVNNIISFIQEEFKNKTSVAPLFLYEKEGCVQPIAIPNSVLHDNKDELRNMINAVVTAFQPESHCVVVEAWAYKMPNSGSTEQALKALKDFKAGIPNTGVLREEVVSLLFAKIKAGQSVERWVGNAAISRDADNKISHIAPVRWVKEQQETKFIGELVV
jgi:hypothetical protein